ncbi:MAG: trypsin-like peptidase domain-containing protein [Spirochaetes bacterium]|nr:trypsin-like peptidase domain-containing protein [Spirochaetota bacterium]
MVPLFSEELQSTRQPRQATVKIIKTYISPDYCIPWKMKDYSSSVGSGVIIKGKLILTNAHVVSDSTILQVKKENDPNTYEADVLYVGHECDLALLKVKDDNFFKNTVSLDLGGIPELKSMVATYGYPMGGERISITEGVVSRIEIGVYSHSKKSALLMIQTDAAINAGNSGGPVIQEGKISGIAFQAIADSNNIGYMIPTPVIKHFLDDIKDGRYDGFPDVGVFTDELLNESYRESFGMRKDQSGVVITHVIKGSSAENVLKKGDVLLSIDGHKIANDGSISYGYGRIRFSIITDEKQVGDKVTLEILRDKTILKKTVSMNNFPIRIPWFNEFETLPRYYIFGGIVFQPLNREFLKCWDKWWLNADRSMLYYYSYLDRDELKPDVNEIIIINHVLPDAVNTYISDIGDMIISKINGKNICSLEDVIEAFKNPKGDFHIIEVEGSYKPILLKASEMYDANIRILKKYEIPYDRYTGSR